MDRHPRGLLGIAYVRVLACGAHGRCSSGAGWTQLRWGGQRRRERTRHGRTRGEGADLGEGLAAAGKQEAAAHAPTVAAAQAMSQPHAAALGVHRADRPVVELVARRAGSRSSTPPAAAAGLARPALPRPLLVRAAGRRAPGAARAVRRRVARLRAAGGPPACRAAPGRLAPLATRSNVYQGCGRGCSARRRATSPASPYRVSRWAGNRRPPVPDRVRRPCRRPRSPAVVEQREPQTRQSRAARSDGRGSRGRPPGLRPGHGGLRHAAAARRAHAGRGPRVRRMRRSSRRQVDVLGRPCRSGSLRRRRPVRRTAIDLWTAAPCRAARQETACRCGSLRCSARRSRGRAQNCLKQPSVDRVRRPARRRRSAARGVRTARRSAVSGAAGGRRGRRAAGRPGSPTAGSAARAARAGAGAAGRAAAGPRRPPACQASRAPRRSPSTPPRSRSGSSSRSSSSLPSAARSRCSRRQLQPQVAREDARAVAGAGRVARLARVPRGVQHRAGELAVVGPRAAVEVVAAHAGPDVVDHAHLGVHVDRRPRVVLHVEDVHPVRARPAGTSRSPPTGPRTAAAARTRRPGRAPAARPPPGAAPGARASASANSRATSADHMYWSSR